VNLGFIQANGSSTFNSLDTITTDSIIMTYVNVASSSIFRIEQIVSSGVSVFSLGRAVAVGPEIYTTVTLIRIP
jgi:hypothetical protein